MILSEIGDLRCTSFPKVRYKFGSYLEVSAEVNSLSPEIHDVDL